MRFEPKPFVRHTMPELVEEIRRVVLQEFGGVPPTPKHFARVARVKVATIAARFGTYAKAMAAAGFTYLTGENCPLRFLLRTACRLSSARRQGFLLRGCDFAC
jgi:hypothetical protein